MEIKICNDNKEFPYLYVDDWYTPEEEKLIWKELDFYTNPFAMHRGETENTYRAEKERQLNPNNPQNKSWRMYMDTVGAKITWEDRAVSHILRLQLQKILSIRDSIDKLDSLFESFWKTNHDEHYIVYYEDGDYYKKHRDFGEHLITTITWFHRIPKAFTGGEFILNDIDVTLESKHNRMLMYPSYYTHEVLPLEMDDKNYPKLGGQGRYAIINFYYILNEHNKS